MQTFTELARRGREGRTIPLKELKEVTKREPIVVLPQNAKLPQAVEIFGSGVHRLLVTKEGTQDVIGILTQLRLVRFFWENGRDFPHIDKLYANSLMVCTCTRLFHERPVSLAPLLSPLSRFRPILLTSPSRICGSEASQY